MSKSQKEQHCLEPTGWPMGALLFLFFLFPAMLVHLKKKEKQMEVRKRNPYGSASYVTVQSILYLLNGKVTMTTFRDIYHKSQYISHHDTFFPRRWKEKPPLKTRLNEHQ